MIVVLPFLLLLMGIHLVQGMIGKDTYSIGEDDAFSIIWEFKADVGASINMSILVDNTKETRSKNETIQFLACRDSDLTPLRSATLEEVCSSSVFDAVPCLWQTQLAGPKPYQDSFGIKTTHQDWYYLLQLNCHGNKYNVHLDYIAVNPGNEYLSMADVPYKLLFKVSGAVWSCALLLGVINWFPYRHFNVKLQQVISLVPCFQILVCYLMSCLWEYRSTTGKESSVYFWTSFYSAGLSRGLFFGVLILTAKGWGVLRNSLMLSEVKQSSLVILLLMTSYWLYMYFGGFLLFLVVIMYCMALRQIFAAVLENSQALIGQLQLIRQVNVEAASAPVFEKYQMYKKFQTVTVVYICVDVIFHLWAKIFLRQNPWIEDLIEQIIFLSTVLTIGYIFRMRPFKPYFFQISSVGEELSQRSSEGSVSSDLVSPLILEDDGQWRPGMEIPVIPKGYSLWFQPYEEEVVIVEEPSGTGSTRRLSVGQYLGRVPSQETLSKK